MYDAREKAIRDKQWELKASRIEGRIEGEKRGETKGEIRLIRSLQEILQVPVSQDDELQTKPLDELRKLTAILQERIRSRG